MNIFIIFIGGGGGGGGPGEPYVESRGTKAAQRPHHTGDINARKNSG